MIETFLPLAAPAAMLLAAAIAFANPGRRPHVATAFAEIAALRRGVAAEARL